MSRFQQTKYDAIIDIGMLLKQQGKSQSTVNRVVKQIQQAKSKKELRDVLQDI